MIGDLWEVRLYTVAGDNTGTNVLHFQVTNQVGADMDALSVADHFDVLMAPLYKAVMTPSASWYGVLAQKIRPAPPLFPAGRKSLTGPGTTAGDPMPGQLSGIITKRTAKAGKAYRGRIYIPFPGEADNDIAGLPTAAYQTRVTALAAGVRGPHDIVGGAGQTATFAMVLFHRDTNTADLVTDLRINNKWATQRRRGVYGQPDAPPF